MKVTVYAVVREGDDIACWTLTRKDAIERAAEMPPGRYEIVEGVIEGGTWASLVVAALNDAPDTETVAVVVVDESRHATLTETVTRTLARGGAS